MLTYIDGPSEKIQPRNPSQTMKRRLRAERQSGSCPVSLSRLDEISLKNQEFGCWTRLLAADMVRKNGTNGQIITYRIIARRGLSSFFNSAVWCSGTKLQSMEGFILSALS